MISKAWQSQRQEAVKSFAGCLNCKKKKKKCDERRPKCSRCEKANTNCVWSNFLMVNPHEHSVKSKFTPISKEESNHENELIEEGILRTTYDENTMKPEHKPSLVQEISLDSKESYCFSYFLFKFLPSLLKPFVNYLPLDCVLTEAARRSALLREVFIACGATMIAFENKEYKSISCSKYFSALRLLVDDSLTSKTNNSEGDLLIAVQMLQVLCFRENFNSTPGTTALPHFIAAYQIIRKRFLESDYHSLLISQDHEQHDKLNQDLDENLVQTFIFNYTVILFFGRLEDSRKLMPDPFYLFDKLPFWKVANGNIESEINYFTRHAFDAAIKSVWMCRVRYPLNNEDRVKCANIFCNALTILDDFDKLTARVENRVLKKAMSVSKITLRVSLILIRKMLNFERSCNDFHYDLGLVIKDMNEPYNESIIVPGWVLLVAFCASVKDYERIYFKRQLHKMSNKLNSTMLFQIIDFMDTVCDETIPCPLELIFESSLIDVICL